MPIRPSTHTYEDLLRTTKRLFGDESGVQLEDEDIRSWANEGLDAIVTRNKIYRTKSTTTTVAEQATYDFPGLEIYEISSVEVSGQLVPNIPFEDAELRIMSYDPDRLERGTPAYWYLWDDEFTFWPTPDAEYPVVLRYVRMPTTIDGSPSQVIDVPDKYFSALVDYVLAKCYEMDEDWQAAGAKIQSFEAAINIHGESERNAQEMSYPVIREVEW